MTQQKTLIALVGPTAVGKTDLSIAIAQRYGTEIVSCDSRQIFRDIPIATAAPSADEQKLVKHHFIATHSLDEPMSAADYERQALSIIQQLHTSHDVVLLTGGSMLYLDAVCQGIDEMPDVLPHIRKGVYDRYDREGLEPLLEELHRLDPDYYERVDKKNPKRVLHGLEMCLSTGRPFSSFHRGEKKQRPFRIVKIGLMRPRQELYARIDQRVELMLQDGLEEEARKVYPLRHLNSLNTVGLKEVFMYFDGTYSSLEQAAERICHNTHIYSKKQMTWLLKDPETTWFHPDDKDKIMQYLDKIVPRSWFLSQQNYTKEQFLHRATDNSVVEHTAMFVGSYKMPYLCIGKKKQINLVNLKT